MLSCKVLCWFSVSLSVLLKDDSKILISFVKIWNFKLQTWQWPSYLCSAVKPAWLAMSALKFELTRFYLTVAFCANLFIHYSAIYKEGKNIFFLSIFCFNIEKRFKLYCPLALFEFSDCLNFCTYIFPLNGSVRTSYKHSRTSWSHLLPFHYDNFFTPR